MLSTTEQPRTGENSRERRALESFVYRIFCVKPGPTLAENALQSAARLEGGGERSLVEVIEFATHRHTLREARDGDAA